MPFDSALQRKIWGRFATGVTVVTTAKGDKLHGLTANAVCSVSLDPPLVLVSVDKRAGSYPDLLENRCYAVNLLAANQEDLSQRFAKPGPKDFTGLTWRTAVTGAPIFAGTLGWVDCRIVDVLQGGDHEIFLGEIVAGELGEEGPPLLYFSGKYRQLAE
ncbi:MAG: flavin reductase family protein [Planctomycetales bacterium]